MYSRNAEGLAETLHNAYSFKLIFFSKGSIYPDMTSCSPKSTSSMLWQKLKINTEKWKGWASQAFLSVRALLGLDDFYVWF